MKMPHAFFPAGIALAVTFLCGAAGPEVRAANEIVLINFGDIRRDPDGKMFRPYEFSYQDWDKRRVTDLPGRGVLVKAPSGKGGLGENRTMVRFEKAPSVELVFVIGTANKANGMNFALTDRDGTEHQWSIPFATRPPGHQYRQAFDLTKPDREPKPGKTPGLDLKKISSWQVQGDFSEPAIEVLLVKLVGHPK